MGLKRVHKQKRADVAAAVLLDGGAFPAPGIWRWIYTSLSILFTWAALVVTLANIAMTWNDPPHYDCAYWNAPQNGMCCLYKEVM